MTTKLLSKVPINYVYRQLISLDIQFSLPELPIRRKYAYYNICYINPSYLRIRISVHARSRDPKLFFNGVNFTAVENDIAVLKVKNPEDLTCTERHIWPACLPDKV